MNTPKYRVTQGGKSRVVDSDVIAAFCLHRCGGGYNPKQVADAMEMQRNAIETGQLSKTITVEVLT